MNSDDDLGGIRLTRAHLLRHSPRGAGSQGQEAVLVDVAEDLLLRDLHRVGLMHDPVFKGGTALRKLYAGTAGRFSLDLDFCVRDIGSDDIPSVSTAISPLRQRSNTSRSRLISSSATSDPPLPIM